MQMNMFSRNRKLGKKTAQHVDVAKISVCCCFKLRFSTLIKKKKRSVVCYVSFSKGVLVASTNISTNCTNRRTT